MAHILRQTPHSRDLVHYQHQYIPRAEACKPAHRVQIQVSHRFGLHCAVRLGYCLQSLQTSRRESKTRPLLQKFLPVIH